MTVQNGRVRGRAIFGTWVGLESYGNGVLAGAQDTLGIFEFGRNRNDPIHQFEVELAAAVFCRRAKGEAPNQEIELLGAVAPYKDAEGRNGFLGGCVAVDVDSRRPRRQFGDWAALEEDIESAFAMAQESFENRKRGPFLRDHPVLPANDDRKINWGLIRSDVRLLHWGAEWDRAVFEYMQAIAFKEGTEHPTLLVFKFDVEGSQSLQSNDYGDCLGKLRKAKAEVPRQKSTDPILSGSHFRSRVQAPEEQTSDRLLRLERRVLRLENEIDALQSKDRQFRPAASQSPSFRENGTASYPVLKVVVLIACGAVLLTGGILLGAYFLGLFSQPAP